MKALRWIPWMLISVALSAQNSVAPNAATGTFRISGMAVNAVDGSPLSGMEITIGAVDRQDEARQAITGADGRFVFEKLARGKYSLAGAGRGFTQQAYQQHDQYS